MKTYENSTEKRHSQEITLRGQNQRVIALGGPNVSEYVRVLRERGFQDITIYENNPEVYLQQREQNPDCELLFGNILDHLDEDAFYDLDFCCCIRSIESYLPKILELKEFSLTFCLRPIGFLETIEIFRKYGEADFIRYRDTSPMITFFLNLKQQENAEKNNSLLLN